MLRQLDMAPYDHYRPQAGRDNDGSQIIWYWYSLIKACSEDLLKI